MREVDEVQWLPGWQRAPLDETARISSGLAGRAWAGQSAPLPTLLLFRTLKRVNAMRPRLLCLVTRNLRSAKLMHLRSRHAMARWLALVTASADRAAVRVR